MADPASYLSDMNTFVPADSDNRSEGAGEIRAVKSILKRTFPTLKGSYSIDTRPFIPIGFVGMYSGSPENLSEGWAICDGSEVNGIRTPDLRGKFIMGATESEVVGRTGGSHTYSTTRGISVAGHALTEAEMPPHRHNYVADDNHTVGVTQWGCEKVQQLSGGGSDGGGSSWGYRSSSVGSGRAHAHGLNGSTQDYRPAYYTLAYIMFVGIPVS